MHWLALGALDRIRNVGFEIKTGNSQTEWLTASIANVGLWVQAHLWGPGRLWTMFEKVSIAAKGGMKLRLLHECWLFYWLLNVFRACVGCHGWLRVAESWVFQLQIVEMADVVSFSTLIKAHLMNQQVVKACGAIDQMNEQGMHPNRVTSNALINAVVAKAGGVGRSRIWDAIDEMKVSEVKPNQVICAFAHLGWVWESRSEFETMYTFFLVSKSYVPDVDERQQGFDLKVTQYDSCSVFVMSSSSQLVLCKNDSCEHVTDCPWTRPAMVEHFIFQNCSQSLEMMKCIASARACFGHRTCLT